MVKWDSTATGLAVYMASSNVDEDGQFAEILTNAIAQITSVRLYEETVKKVHEGHGGEFPAALPSVIAVVAQTIQNPTHVEQSYKNSYVFVNSDATNAAGDPLRVPVKLHSGTSGLVKTYFCASTENEQKIVYRRPDATE